MVTCNICVHSRNSCTDEKKDWYCAKGNTKPCTRFAGKCNDFKAYLNLEEVIACSSGYVLVSTVDLTSVTGVNPESVYGGQYETLVFSCDNEGIVENFAELEGWRYITEEEARNGHLRLCEIWSKK